MSTCIIIPEEDLISYQSHGSLDEGINLFKKWVNLRDQSFPQRYQTINNDLMRFADQLVLDGVDRHTLNLIAAWDF